jgi:hypothetical protein
MAWRDRKPGGNDKAQLPPGFLSRQAIAWADQHYGAEALTWPPISIGAAWSAARGAQILRSIDVEFG